MKILCLTYKSVTLELENNKTAYFAPAEFTVTLNGKAVKKTGKNVFSLFGLESGKGYTVEASGERAEFVLPAPYAEADVKLFGARGDGKHDDTDAFAAAINCMPAGSVVTVPAGIYAVGPLFLKSGITVYLEKGARLSFRTDREKYPVLSAVINCADGTLNFGTWQGEEADCFASPLYSYGQKNIAVIGEGEIDCNAADGDWYVNHRVKRGAWRPRGMFFNRCENVLVQGVTVKNTASWNIHPYFCKDVKLYGLSLQNPPEMPTTDGVDPDCCDGVEIIGADISVGDDCIAVKSCTLEAAEKYRTACKNITIRNCLMREGHGGVVFGSELSGGIENVLVERCIFDGTDRGFRIKTRRGRGRIGKCDGVNFSNVVMKNVKVPFVINMYYNMGDENGHTEYVWSTKKLPVDNRTPEVGSFCFKNVMCTGVEYAAGAFYGLPESPIKRVELERVSFTYNTDCEAGFPDMREKNEAVKNIGLDFRFTEGVRLKDVTFCGVSGEKVLTECVGETEIN